MLFKWLLHCFVQGVMFKGKSPYMFSKDVTMEYLTTSSISATKYFQFLIGWIQYG